MACFEVNILVTVEYALVTGSLSDLRSLLEDNLAIYDGHCGFPGG